MCKHRYDFLLHCDFYNELREELFTFVFRTNPTFCSYTDADKMKFLMRKEVVKNTAQFIQKAYMKRRRALYK